MTTTTTAVVKTDAKQEQAFYVDMLKAIAKTKATTEYTGVNASISGFLAFEMRQFNITKDTAVNVLKALVAKNKLASKPCKFVTKSGKIMTSVIYYLPEDAPIADNGADKFAAFIS